MQSLKFTIKKELEVFTKVLILLILRRKSGNRDCSDFLFYLLSLIRILKNILSNQNKWFRRENEFISIFFGCKFFYNHV